MKIGHIILASILCLSTLGGFASETSWESKEGETEEVFSSKDKDFLQQWHYEQVLTMDLSEGDRDAYFSHLNYYTYKMSRLGSPKYQYNSTERKERFDELVKELNLDMKNTLSSNNYSIHLKVFSEIEYIVYKKRNWGE